MADLQRLLGTLLATGVGGRSRRAAHVAGGITAVPPQALKAGDAVPDRGRVPPGR
jgi:hypothetical protein